MTASSESKSTWVTIKTVGFISEALGIRMALEAEGIEAFIPEEHTSSINPLMTALQVRIQVRSGDAEAAKNFLAAEKPPVAEKCALCGEERLIKEEPRRNKNWFLAFFGLLFGLPMRRSTQSWRCENCRDKR